MRKHSHTHSQAHKEDYRDILSQRSPEHQIAVMKLVMVTILMAIVVSYMFVKA